MVLLLVQEGDSSSDHKIETRPRWICRQSMTIMIFWMFRIRRSSADAIGLLCLHLLSLFPSTTIALDGGTPRIMTTNGWKAIEVITQGDSKGPSGWSMPNLFDGGGAFLVDSNTIRIQVNHETTDAKISEVDVDKSSLKAAIQTMITNGSTGGVSFVKNARLAYESTNLASGSSRIFCRFCSSQAYAPHTFGTNRGFVDQLYITGEECARGRLMVLNSSDRTLYQLSGLVGSSSTTSNAGIGGMPYDPWENAALVDTGETSHVALLLSPDGGSQIMKLYIGHKGRESDGSNSNSFLARNGLANGSWYYLKGTFPNTVGPAVTGSFDTSSNGALKAVKIEDVDTSPSDPTRVVLGVQKSGVFTFRFTLDFRSGYFQSETSSFQLTKIAASLQASHLNSPDNVDWTDATTLSSGASYPEGIIFVNEDNSSGEIWSMKPDGSEKTRVGSTTEGSEGTGLFDLSELVDYAPGSIMITSSQGSPSSMTLLINPDARALSTDKVSLPTFSIDTFHAVDTQI